MARFARLEGASCCGVHSEGNPSGPFVLGLQGLGLKGLKCASRPMRSAARASCVLRSVPKSKLMAGPAMSGLRRITAGGNNGALRAFWMGSVPAARLVLHASRLIDWD